MRSRDGWGFSVGGRQGPIAQNLPEMLSSEWEKKETR